MVAVVSSRRVDAMASTLFGSSSVFGLDTGFSSKLLSVAGGSARKPRISIRLSDPRSTYSTLDKISGTVEITAMCDTPFDMVRIQFIGIGTTGAYSTGTASQIFLKLTVPASKTAHEGLRVLEAGHRYEFPFTFVVPEQLLPHVCRHGVEHDSVRLSHLQLPPSLGSYGHCAGGVDYTDDFAPAMAIIQYNIVAVLSSDSEGHALASEIKQVRILPVVEEQPPLVVEGPESDFTMRNEKTISRGLLKGSLGTLVAQAAQPESFPSHIEDSASGTPVSTMVHVKLRFDPADIHVAPPRLGDMQIKLKATTWYATAARTKFPANSDISRDVRQGKYSKTALLSSRSIENVEWTFHQSEKDLGYSERDPSLRKHALQGADIPGPSEKYQNKGFYLAQVSMPATLPADKNVMPTFHTCLMSRTYQLNVKIATSSGSMASPSVELKLPIQVSSERRCGGKSLLSPWSSLALKSQEGETDDAYGFSVARTSESTEELLFGRSSDMPPIYEARR